MPADNEICNQPGDIWWDEHQPLHAIRTSLNPARMQYFASAFAARGLDPAGKVVIDVGCGGLVAEEMARLGAAVIGVDPSAASARVLKPGGLYLFDTINRTRPSRPRCSHSPSSWPPRKGGLACTSWPAAIPRRCPASFTRWPGRWIASATGRSCSWS